MLFYFYPVLRHQKEVPWVEEDGKGILLSAEEQAWGTVLLPMGVLYVASIYMACI
jgi:hypothetical protein